MFRIISFHSLLTRSNTFVSPILCCSAFLSNMLINTEWVWEASEGIEQGGGEVVLWKKDE
jgi:hypothetical protein